MPLFEKSREASLSGLNTTGICASEQRACVYLRTQKVHPCLCPLCWEARDETHDLPSQARGTLARESLLNPSYPPTRFYLCLDGLLLTLFSQTLVYISVQITFSPFWEKAVKGGESSTPCPAWTSKTLLPQPAPFLHECSRELASSLACMSSCRLALD